MNIKCYHSILLLFNMKVVQIEVVFKKNTKIFPKVLNQLKVNRVNISLQETPVKEV